MITEIFAPVNFPIDGAEVGPMVIFKDVTSIYLKVNFLKWCEIGLAEIGASRQLENKVIRHVQTEFIGLIDAVLCIALTMEDEDKLEENFNQYLANYYQKDAKARDILNPAEFCLAYFRGITRESTISILWLLMEVVSANKDKYEYQREQKHILTLFERYSALIACAYDWNEDTRKHHRSNKKKKKKKK